MLQHSPQVLSGVGYEQDLKRAKLFPASPLKSLERRKTGLHHPTSPSDVILWSQEQTLQDTALSPGQAEDYFRGYESWFDQRNGVDLLGAGVATYSSAEAIEAANHPDLGEPKSGDPRPIIQEVDDLADLKSGVPDEGDGLILDENRFALLNLAVKVLHGKWRKERKQHLEELSSAGGSGMNSSISHERKE